MLGDLGTKAVVSLCLSLSLSLSLSSRSLELVLLREDPARAKALQSVRSNGLSWCPRPEGSGPEIEPRRLKGEHGQKLSGLETLPEPLCQDRDIVLAAVA